jgi:hypothetical protein
MNEHGHRAIAKIVNSQIGGRFLDQGISGDTIPISCWRVTGVPVKDTSLERFGDKQIGKNAWLPRPRQKIENNLATARLPRKLSRVGPILLTPVLC